MQEINNTLVVVGVQWGDEGKGKMTDYLGQKADVVVRYQGGNNAGHTITFGGNKYALQSIPSGVFNPHIKNVMANGMVINPKAAIAELEGLKQRGITDFQLFISDRAAVIMPYHIALDGAYEALKGGKQIGTTKKGIGPAYCDKYSRVGIRIGDLIDPEYFAERLRDALTQKNVELRALGLEEMDFDTLYKEFLAYGEVLRPYICDTSILLNKEIEAIKERVQLTAYQKNQCTMKAGRPIALKGKYSDVLALELQGLSDVEICQKLGISKTTLWRYRKQANEDKK